MTLLTESTSDHAVLKPVDKSDDRLLFEEAQKFESLLNYLWESHSFDFSNYKRSSLMRRVRQRMKLVAIADYSDYIDYLNKHPDEFTALYKFFPINFTKFFRDKQVWDHIATEVIPRIIANKAPDELIKVWSAGCASGEELYTLAILLIEALGVEQFKQRVRIYGTDIDEDAIHQARQGIYSSNQVVGVPPALLGQYFEQTEAGYCFRKDLRCPMIFVQRNLLEDAPLSKIDLLVCRNALMYFTIEGQIRALVRFHFGLRDRGFLVLGNIEMPTPNIDVALFTSVNRQHHIFSKLPKGYTPLLLIQAFKKRKTSVIPE